MSVAYNPTVFDIDTIDRNDMAERSRGVVEAEKQCKITLAADWREGEREDLRVVPLHWNPGGGANARDSIIWLRPGETVVQPLSKAMAWFGPFAIPLEFATADDRRKAELRKFWAIERERYLQRFGWPMVGGDQKPDMRKTGHNRAPHVVITILEADGTASEPIDTHRLYKIGEYDSDKDSFVTPETLDAVQLRHAAELAGRDAELAEMRRGLAEVKGFQLGIAAKLGAK